MQEEFGKAIPPTPLGKGGISRFPSHSIKPARVEGSSSAPIIKRGANYRGGFDKDTVRKRGLTWNGSHLPYNSANVEKARSLRRKMTPAEKKLWYGFLRNFKYRILKQRPIDHYIADFYCARLRLVIELDGWHHLTRQKEYDKTRSDILKLYGLKILRFSNDDVLNNFEKVCERIRAIPPSPLEKGGVEDIRSRSKKSGEC